MATVYKAKCHVLNRYVAVKILRDEFTTDEEFVKRFEIEAQSAASITNANIVSVYDVGVEGNLHYIVMELVQGKTLKEIIVKEGGPLPWKWSVNIAMQIASALDVAHKNNIIHRDIKPHNIIITEDGVAKVTDFGIAKAVSNSTITAFGTTIGSVHYFSPEHAKGGITDAKSDLYSLGVVMYEMLTGKVPFDADTPVSVALKHMQEPPVPPIEKNPKIPKALNYIILKSLEKDKNLRYSSAVELLADLKLALKDPEGKFIEERKALEEGEFPTQRIDALYEEKIETGKNSNSKKENKFKEFCMKHKKGLIIVAIMLALAIILIGSFAITLNQINSSRPAEVQVPNLIGKTLEEAEQIAKENNLKIVEGESDYNSEYEEGIIYSQDPEYKNIKINEGTEITVKVSKGIEKTTMPKVVGETKADAIDMLTEAKLNAEVIEQNDDKVPSGTVISQEVEKDTELNAGDTVKIYVSKGQKEVAVPSVVGKDLATAKSALEAVNLVVDVVYEENTAKTNGVVLEQSHKTGTAVTEGTTITLTVNQIEEVKNCAIKVNVAKITGYSAEYDESGNLVEPENVTIKLYVDGTEYNSFTDVKESIENYDAKTVSGKGTITVKLTITSPNGTIKTKTTQLNLKEVSSYTFE
jgi:serine/threonine-protein kinase